MNLVSYMLYLRTGVYGEPGRVVGDRNIYQPLRQLLEALFSLDKYKAELLNLTVA